MKVKFSPLVASMSGTAADAVMASWKGIQYVRKHVIPHNPDTDAQKLVRNSLTRCVTLWRSLGTVAKAWLNKYAVDYRLSGFNVFVQKNRALEQAEAALLVMPPNPYVNEPTDFAGSVVVAEKITATWTDDVVTGFTNMFLVLRHTTEDIFAGESLVILASAETHDFLLLTTAQKYWAYGAYYNPTTGDIGSVACSGELTVT